MNDNQEPYSKLKNFLASNNFTKTIKNTKEFNSSNKYQIISNDDKKKFADIKFQIGQTKEVELNGCFMEDLIFVCIDRLEDFQESNFNCKENENALKHLYEAIFWLNARTKKRQSENKYGTYQK